MKKSTIIALTLLFISTSIKLNAQELTIFQGTWGAEYYQDSEKVDKKELMSILEKHPESHELFKKSNTYQTLAWVTFAANMGFGIWTYQTLQDDTDGAVPAVATLATAATYVIFAISANKKRKEAILKYNEALDSKTSFRIEPSKSGLGIALTF